jgi:ribonucleotide monophosphatase NagD (HAD superfamily)
VVKKLGFVFFPCFPLSLQIRVLLHETVATEKQACIFLNYELSIQTGKIAQRYVEIGGTCNYFGKPHVQHFKACLRELGLEPGKVAHVGDSLHHDVAGANAAGISSVFITAGIHHDDLNCCMGEVPTEETLKAFFDREGHVPTYVAPLLKF